MYQVLSMNLAVELSEANAQDFLQNILKCVCVSQNYASTNIGLEC